MLSLIAAPAVLTNQSALLLHALRSFFLAVQNVTEEARFVRECFKACLTASEQAGEPG